MKKTLSLLLAICMLASLCTVPAWAEEDAAMDFPVIEEITAEELEEGFQLFGEEVTETGTKFVEIETSEDDGITLLNEIEGVSVIYNKMGTSGSEGNILSLSNGIKTVGEEYRTSTPTNEDGILEGFMIRAGDSLTIDFGQKMAFSGIRVWETARSRSYQIYGNDMTDETAPRPNFRRLKNSKISFSDDNERWYSIAPAAATYDNETHTGDMFYMFSTKGAMNLNARYIKFENTSVLDGGVFELEEIAMFDAVEANPTWSLNGNEIPTDAYESVVGGSQWNSTTYADTRAWDNEIALFEAHFWHSMPNDEAYNTDEARTLTFELKEATEIGGVRIWPRNDGDGTTPAGNSASMRTIQLLGSTDNENWFALTPVSADFHQIWDATAGKKYSTPIDYCIRNTINSTVKYVKVVGKNINTTKYVCAPEVQLLGAGAKTAVGSYVTDDDVIYLETTPSITAVYSSLGKGVATSNGMFDGSIYQMLNTKEGYYRPYTGSASADPRWEIDNALTGDGYVTIDIDLGKAYTFSAARIFGRWNQPGQSINKGYILVSDNGADWYQSDLFADAVRNTPASGIAFPKYDSTGDIYCNIPTKFDENVNITARYIRIYCAETQGGNHWSWQELLLVKPDSKNETYTVSELAAKFAADAAAVEALIEKIPAEILSSDEATVVAAKEAYDDLHETYAKPLVSEEAVAKLEAAVEAKNGLIYEVRSNKNSGLDTITFTIPARENTEIASVAYVDSFGNTLDGKSATTVAPDGDNLVISIAGAYTTATGLTGNNAPDNTYYYGNTRPEFSWWVQGEKIKAEHFTGIYPRLVAADGVGDHIIKLTFADGVTYNLNYKTTYIWDDIDTAAAIEGTEYTDEITPKTSWKATTTNQNYNMDDAFNGKAEYLIRKGGDTKTGDRYESDYVTGTTQDTAGGTASGVKVMMYKPVRMDFIIDTGEATEVSGVRIYPRVSSYNVDKTKGSTAGAPTKIVYWGSDDLENWENLGEYNFSTNCGDKTAKFTENVAYRYYKGSVLRANGNEYLATVSISELAFLKPSTLLSSDASVAVDVSEPIEAGFLFDVLEGDSVASVKDASGADVEYSFANGKVVIDVDYLKTLADGTYKFTIAFAKGATYEVSVVKKDTSKVTYKVFASNNRGTDALVLNKSNDAAVTGVAIKGGNAITKYTVSEDNKTITIARQNFRKAADLFALTDVDKNGEIQVVVSYEGGEKTYTVTLVAEWGKVLGTTAVYAEDELVADNAKWRARASSVQNENQPGNALSNKEITTKDAQNWHTFFDGTNGGDSTKAQGHYFDIDFGGNPEPYVGIRHTERPGGTTWNTRVVITAKNNAADEWITIFDGKPAYTKIGEYHYFEADKNDTDGDGDVKELIIPAYVNINQGEMFFAEPVTYRYLRLHIVTASEHITADTIRIIKETTKLESAENVDVDVNYAEEAAYSFHVVGSPVVSVAVGAEALEADAYTFENGVLTLTAAFTGTLPAGKTDITVTINGKAFTVSVTRVDKYAATYTLADGANVRGTNDLVLPVVGDAVPTKVMYGEVEVPFTFADGAFTIKRNNFRSLDDLFDMDEIVLAVTFGEEVVKNYTVTLVNNGITLTGVSTAEGAFASDEIKPVNGEWTIKASSGNTNAMGAHTMFTMTSNGLAWHSAYTEISGNAVPDSTIGRKYIEVNFGEATKLSGFRYYLRQDKDSKDVLQTAGTWNGATIYGRNSADAEWTLIKSQSFIFEDIVEKTYAEVYFSEDVTYNEVRIVIDCGHHATGRGFTFLNARPAAPEPEEDEVNIKVTPTTGGNVIVNEAPTQGDNYVAANTEVTFTASNNAGSTFQYWIEANTGKILGTEKDLTVASAAGKDIKAVFADPSSAEAFVSFFGRNAKSVISHSYVKKGATPKAPSLDKLYTTGYNFLGWVTSADKVENATAEDLVTLGAINENASYYAVYEAKEEKKSTITVEGGMIKAAEGGTFATEGTFAYDTYVVAKADTVDGQKFSYWTIDGKVVSYKSTYEFYAPDADIALVANFVADDAVVKEAVTITMTKTLDEVNGVKVASFLTTRYVPTTEDVEVLETGVIYVKDASYGTLSIAEIGKTSAAGKVVKVATSDKKTSGQYKLTASYVEGLGIKAVGFITYVEGDKVTTIYTAEMSQQ